MMRIILGLLFSLLTLPLMADDIMPLDKVNFHITQRQWVKTDQARVVVRINATLTDTDLAKARQNIINSLNQLAKGEWHLTRFNRSQDSSGLEKLQVLAEARVPQSALNTVYQQAKAVTKPGTSYSIANIDFKPSLEDMQQAEINLRQALYQQVQQEMERINKVYTQQHFSLASLQFMRGNQVPQLQSRDSAEMNVMMVKAAAPSPAVSVSEELVVTALVEAASVRPSEPVKRGD